MRETLETPVHVGVDKHSFKVLVGVVVRAPFREVRLILLQDEEKFILLPHVGVLHVDQAEMISALLEGLNLSPHGVLALVDWFLSLLRR